MSQQIKGTVQYQSLENEFWSIITDDGRTLVPTNMPEQLKYDGVKVQCYVEPSDAFSNIMVGELVDIISFSTLQVGNL